MTSTQTRLGIFTLVMIAGIFIGFGGQAMVPIAEAEERKEIVKNPECEPRQGLPLKIIRSEVTDIYDHWGEDCIRRFLEFYTFLDQKWLPVDWSFYYGQQEKTGKFRPDDPVTRAEWLKILFAGDPIAGECNISCPPGYVPLLKRHRGVFRDVEKHWVYRRGYIQEALDRGLIFPEDYWKRRFEPDRPITRLEATIIALRVYAGDMGPFPPDEERNPPLGVKRRVWGLISIPASNPFWDLEAIPPWARPHVLTAARLGLIKGRPDGRFDPRGVLTRAEAAVMVWRYWMAAKWCDGCRPR